MFMFSSSLAQTYHSHICSWWGWSTVIWKRRETERGTDICFAARSYKRLIIITLIFLFPPNDEDKWENKKLKASRTCYKIITVRVLGGNAPAMGHNWRTNGSKVPLLAFPPLLVVDGQRGASAGFSLAFSAFSFSLMLIFMCIIVSVWAVHR